jgi:CheY-like chemotaxis protein
MIRRYVSGAPFRILLVEDNPAHAELVVRSVNDHRLEMDIYHAINGEVALDYLFRRGAYADSVENPLPHIILLDIRMPKLDGLDVLREIKQSESLRHIPTIILTTSEEEQDVDQAYKCYVNSYLVKPVDFDEFTQLIDDLAFYWLNWNHLQTFVDGVL